MYILAVIEHATRRVYILGPPPTRPRRGSPKAARNLVMDLHDAGSNVQYLIRDRGGKYPALFDTTLADAGDQGRAQRCPFFASTSMPPELHGRHSRQAHGRQPVAAVRQPPAVHTGLESGPAVVTETM
jgi:hypothetical protein